MPKNNQNSHTPPHTTWFKIKCSIQYFITKLFKYRHRSHSFPFITGDGFRSIAHHVYDEKYIIDPTKVADKDILFVRGDLLIYFFAHIHPLINVQYILISHNSDQHVTDYYAKFVDNKIIHWFGQNVLFTHEKVTPIPIGISNRIYDPKNIIVDNILKNKTTSLQKDMRIFGAFNTNTNPNRPAIAKMFAQNPLSIQCGILSMPEYYRKLASFNFSISPEGNGFDCHRTWESIYVGTIPITIENSATTSWKNLGIPLFTIPEWSMIGTLDSATLIRVKEQMHVACPAIYMNYWIEKILKYTHA